LISKSCYSSKGPKKFRDEHISLNGLGIIQQDKLTLQGGMDIEESSASRSLLRQTGSSKNEVLQLRWSNWRKTTDVTDSKLSRSADSDQKFHWAALTSEQILEELINTFWNVEFPFGKYNTKKIAFSHENLFFYILDNS